MGRMRLWDSRANRAILFQSLLIAALAGAVWYFVSNALDNLGKSGMSLGFAFLGDRSSFDIGANTVGFRPGDSVARAFAAGVVNTLLVSIASIVAATVLGGTLGISRLSANPLLAAVARLYVETVRNIPLLLQVLLWHAIVTRALPPPRLSVQPTAGVFLNNRGLYGPDVTISASTWVALAATVATLLIWWIAIAAPRVADERPSAGWRTLCLGVALTLVWTVAISKGDLRLMADFPSLKGFNFVGGASVSPEYLAIFLGLTIYTAGFIAETVRSGILSVDAGQREAATSLGLRPGAVTRLIVLPQALRVIIPPMSSQYLSMIKNSSLAVAVGFPETIRVATIVTSETGRAIEVIVIVMAIYLTFSLTISGLMNLYNRSLPARN